MELSTVIWWLVFSRAMVGSVFCAIGVQMVFHAYREIVIREERKQNGMEGLILKGQVQFGWLLVTGLGLLGSSAWLALPFIVRHSYHWRQVVATSFVLLLTTILATAVWLKWRERGKLLAMAGDYRKKTPAEGGPTS